MGTIALEIFEDKLLNKSTINFNLSVLIGADRFSFFVYDNSKKVLAFRTYRFLLQSNKLEDMKLHILEMLDQDKLLQKAYASVKVGILNEHVTIVPVSLFNQEEQHAYLKNIGPLKETDLIITDNLSDISSYQLFKLSSSIHRAIQDRFNNSQFYHGQSALIKAYYNHQKNKSASSIYLNVRERSMQLVGFKNGKLTYSNNFFFSASRDFIYYLLLVYKELGLDPNKDRLWISGLISEDSEIYIFIYKYIKYIEFLNFPSYLEFGRNFKTAVKGHHFFDLYSVCLCE